MKRMLKAIIVFLDKIYRKLYNENSLSRGINRHTLPKIDNYWNIVELNDDLELFTKRHWVEILKELFDIINVEYYSRIQKIMQEQDYENIPKLWYITDILDSMSAILFDKLNGND
jgi:hypothetical protein